MPSLYDAVRAENSNYVPQFVGSNYEQLNESAAILDQRYRQNKDYTDKIAMMVANDQYLANDQALKEKMMQSIYGAIDKIASSEKGFENSTAAVSQVARDYFTNQERLTGIRNFQLAEEAKKLEREGYNLNFGDDWRTFSTLGEEGQPRQFNLNLQKQYDYDKKMKELVGNINPDAGVILPTGEKLEFDGDERNLIKSGQWQSISPNKVRRLVEALMPAYRESQEGQQDIQRLTQIKGLTGEPLQIQEKNSVRTTTDIDEDIRQRFLANIMPQAFYGETQRWDDFGETAASAAKQAIDNLHVDTSPGSVTANNVANPVPVDAADDDPYLQKDATGQYYQWVDKKTGEVVTEATVDEWLRVNKPTYVPGPMGFGNNVPADPSIAFDKKPVDLKVVKARKADLYDTSMSVFENLGMDIGFENEKHFDRSLKRANEVIKNTTVNGFAILDEQKDLYNRELNAGLHRKKLITPTGDVINLERLAEQLGVNREDITLEADQIFYESPNSNIPPGYIEARIILKDGKKAKSDSPLSVFVPGGSAYSATAAPIDHLYKHSIFLGKDTYTGVDNAYYPVLGKKGYLRTADGGERGFYTQTALLPAELQVEGEYPYKTVVIPVTRYRGNGSEEVRTVTDERGMPIMMDIEEWKASMHQQVSPLLDNTLNSGKRATTQDYKRHNPFVR